MDPTVITVSYFDVGGMNVESITTKSNYRLFASGGDGIFNNGNDIDLSGTIEESIHYDPETRVATLTLSSPLVEEHYLVSIDGNSVVSSNGVPLFAGTQVQAVRPLEILASVVTLQLQAASDTGVSNSDRLTRINTPVFDVTVNKPGRIEVDFPGDHQMIEVPAPGTYEFTAPELADGAHFVRARLIPTTGSVVEDELSVTIDTLAPTLLAGPSTEQAPVYSRTVVFSEAVTAPEVGGLGALTRLSTAMGDFNGDGIVDAADYVVWRNSLGRAVAAGSGADADANGKVDSGDHGIWTANFGNSIALAAQVFEGGTLIGPDNIEIPITSIEGSGDTYVVHFAPLTVPGEYVLSGPRVITDLAGNLIEDEPFDEFNVLADTTAPIVTNFLPLGPRNTEANQITVRFNEAILSGSFEVADIAVIGPDGPVSTSGWAITPIGDREFQIAATGFDTEGDYSITIGPNVLDL